MPIRDKTYDVLVAGGGNAALCAAITVSPRATKTGSTQDHKSATLAGVN